MDHMNDTGLNTGFGKGRRDSLWKALEPINHTNKHVIHALVFDLIHELEPEFGPFGLFNPQSRTFL